MGKASHTGRYYQVFCVLTTLAIISLWYNFIQQTNLENYYDNKNNKNNNIPNNSKHFGKYRSREDEVPGMVITLVMAIIFYTLLVCWKNNFSALIFSTLVHMVYFGSLIYNLRDILQTVYWYSDESIGLSMVLTWTCQVFCFIYGLRQMVNLFPRLPPGDIPGLPNDVDVEEDPPTLLISPEPNDIPLEIIHDSASLNPQIIV